MCKEFDFRVVQTLSFNLEYTINTQIIDRKRKSSEVARSRHITSDFERFNKT